MRLGLTRETSGARHWRVFFSEPVLTVDAGSASVTERSEPPTA